MATITSAGSGDWNTGGTWVGGIAPTSADDAIIANTHTVTLSGSCAAQSITVNTGGTLTCSTTVSTTLTIQRGLTQQTGSNVTLDVSSDVAVTCTVILNNVRAASASAYVWTATGTATVILKGYPKKRWTTLTADMAVGATTCTVADATGWQTGDKLVFGTTQAYNATPRVDASTGTNTVSGTSISNITATTYAHASGGLVGNFSSNLVIRPNTTGDATAVRLEHQTRTGFTRTITDVEFNGLGQANPFPSRSLTIACPFAGADGTGLVTPYTRVGNNAFWDTRYGGLNYNNLNTPIPTDNNVYYITTNGEGAVHVASSTYVGNDTDSVVFRGSNRGFYYQTSAGSILTGTKATACPTGGIWVSSEAQLINVDLYSNATGLETGSGGVYGQSCRIGTQFGGAATNTNALSTSVLPKVSLTDSYIQTSGTLISGLSTAVPGVTVDLINRSTDVTVQERYLRDGTIKRDNSVKTRGTSSIAIQPTALASNIQRTQTIPCANGATIRIVGYIRMDTSFWNAGDNNLPTVTLTGLGATPVTFTASAAANNAWEKFDLSITNTSGADGNFTLTYTANAKTVTTGTVYFDGVPDSPFITKVRHYGFLFNETSPTREVNPYTVATEAVAAAYTGVTVNATTKRVSFGVGTADTLAKVYDYSQAWAVTNIDKEVPWTRAGALLSLTSGWTVVDPVISGVTWGGGTVEYSTPGNIEASFDTTTIEFTTAGTYSMGDSIFAGNIELTNTSGGSVTVELPSGTSYTNTGPNITVTTPVLYQSVTINGLLTASRVYIYDTVTATVLANAVASGSSYTWTDTVAASADRNIWLRVAYQSGATAKKFIDVAIGTCGTTDLTAALTYLVNQEDDPVYILNAIDGSTVTGMSIDDSIDKLLISIAGGAVTWPEIYAYEVYWLATSAGIADDAAIIEAIDTANYLLYSFQIRNTSTVPLTITGGYGRDAVTETVAACIDVTGSTGNIYPAPDHVVPFSTGSGLTAGQAAKLESLDTQAVNVVSIQGQAINGSGTADDPWGP